MAGKRKYPKNINVNLTEETFNKLSEEAKDYNCSLSALARSFIEVAIRDGKQFRRRNQNFFNEVILMGEKREDRL
jgi:hypothetical protein